MGKRVWPVSGAAPAGVGNYNSSTQFEGSTFVPNYTAPRYASAYVEPPPAASVDAFNDEFEGGSPDLSLRGFTVYRTRLNPAQAQLTRQGPINPYGYPSTLPADKYLSTLTSDSKLRVQLPAGRYFISKPVTVGPPPWKLHVACKVDAARDYLSYGLAIANRFVTTEYAFTPDGMLILMANASDYGTLTCQGGSTNGWGTLSNRTVVYGAGAHVFELNSSGATGTPARFGLTSGTVVQSSTGKCVYWSEPNISIVNPEIATTMYVGFYLDSNATYGSWFELDYIRKYTPDVWPF